MDQPNSPSSQFAGANGASDQRKAQVRSQFDRLVDDYDVKGPGNFAHFGRRLVEVVGITPGDRVLDVATGRGAALWPAAENAGQSGTVVGIDISEGMVRATRVQAEQDAPSAEVRVMDAEHLEFADASFDRVLCAFGIMFFPNRDRALQEFHRVLRPGGRIAISTWKRSQAADLSEILAESGLPQTSPPGWVSDANELGALLLRVGFEDVDGRQDEQSFIYKNTDHYWQNARGTGVRAAIDALSPEVEASIRFALEERFRRYVLNGRLEIPAIALLAMGTRATPGQDAAASSPSA